MVDAGDLKSPELCSCGFESRRPHQVRASGGRGTLISQSEQPLRSFRFERRDWLLLAVCWLALAAFYLLFANVRDVDDTVRLIQVRALLDGQGWFDLTQHRIAPPEGVPMHWSRLVDLPIAAAILAARVFVDPIRAEHFALVAVPLVTMACAAALIYRAALRLTGARAAAVAAVILGCTAAALFGQLNPGRIDHHGWQVVAALVALNGLLAERRRLGGVAIGAALATWLAISVEALPLTAAFLAVLGLRWLHDRAERDRLVAASAALAVVSALLWLTAHRLDAAALAGWCDVVTPIHLAMLVWTALGVGGVAALPAGGRLRDAGLLGGVALGALAVFALGAPQCLGGGGYNQLDPLVTRFWLGNVGEAMALWTRPLVPAMTMVMPPLLGLASLAWLAWRGRPGLPPSLWSYWLVLAAATGVACVIVRAFAVATAFAAPVLGWALLAWVREARGEPRGGWRLGRWLVLVAALIPWLIQLALVWQVRSDRQRAQSACNLSSHAYELAALPPGTFLAPFDLGPELLTGTRHTILASGHHRAAGAMRDLLAAFLGSPDAARAIVGRRGIEYVAVCFDSPEVAPWLKAAPDGFLAHLARGDVPDWLTPIDIAGANAPKLWRVIASTGPAGPDRQNPNP
jgi:hypothetical protein